MSTDPTTPAPVHDGDVFQLIITGEAEVTPGEPTNQED